MKKWPSSDKMGKLIRLLSSDKQGEVVAAVAALKRSLEAAELDFHALAELIENAINDAHLFQPPPRKPWPEPRSKSPFGEKAQSIHEFIMTKWRLKKPVRSALSLHDKACLCFENIKQFEEKHHGFVRDMVLRTSQGSLTARQSEYLNSLFGKIR